MLEGFWFLSTMPQKSPYWKLWGRLFPRIVWRKISNPSLHQDSFIVNSVAQWSCKLVSVSQYYGFNFFWRLFQSVSKRMSNVSIKCLGNRLPNCTQTQSCISDRTADVEFLPWTYTHPTLDSSLQRRVAKWRWLMCRQSHVTITEISLQSRKYTSPIFFTEGYQVHPRSR